MPKTLLLAFALLAASTVLRAQSDTVAPQLVCKSHPVPGLPLCNTLDFPASYFLESYSDNATPTDSLELGIRRSCRGTGFPENQTMLTLWSADLFVEQAAEVWVRDQAGNTNTCTVQFFITEYTGACDPGVSVEIWTPDTNMLSHAFFKLQAAHCLLDSITITGETQKIPGTLWAGWSEFGTFAAAGYSITAEARKDSDPLNGVSTLDLALIQKHLLGIEPFDSPFKIIAADANQDGQVTSFDLVLLKQLILGVNSQLPNGRSWRIIPFDCQFPNPQNPFDPPLPDKIVLPNTAEPTINHFYFMGIKIGDVNFSADPDQ